MIKRIQNSVYLKFVVLFACLMISVAVGVIVLVLESRNSLMEIQKQSFRSFETLKLNYLDTIRIYEKSLSSSFYDDIANEDVGALQNQVIDHFKSGTVDAFVFLAFDKSSIYEESSSSANLQLSNYNLTDAIEKELLKLTENDPISQVYLLESGDERIFYRRFGQKLRAAGYMITVMNISRFNAEFQALKSNGGKLIEKSNDVLISITLIISIVIFAFALFFVYMIRGKILSPLFTILQAANKVSSGDYSIQIENNSQDEIGELKLAFNRMTSALDETFKENLDHRINLERKVQERTVEVFEKKQKIQSILDNIDEGIVTFGENLLIDSEFSKFITQMFHRKPEEIIGSDIFEVFLEGAHISGDELNLIRETLKASLGEDALNWEANLGHLPTDLAILIKGQERFASLHWKAILNDENEVTKILLSIRDVTEIKELEEKIATERSNNLRVTQKLSEIVSQKQQNVKRFIKNALIRIEIVEKEIQKDSPDLTSAFVELHTIKGAARTMRFRQLSDQCHTLEDIFKTLKDRGGDILISSNLMVREVRENINEYQKIIESFLNNDSGTGEFKNLHHIAAEAIPIIGDHLGKHHIKLGNFQVADEVMFWQQDSIETIQDVLNHAFNNAADHGFIRPINRGAVRKTANFKLKASIDGQNVKIVFIENGYGFNFKKLTEIANQRGHLTPTQDDLIQLIFSAETSTSENVTITSGRGIGMKAIDSMINKLGGTVTMQALEIGTQLEITIPLRNAADIELLRSYQHAV